MQGACLRGADVAGGEYRQQTSMRTNQRDHLRERLALGRQCGKSRTLRNWAYLEALWLDGGESIFEEVTTVS